jgi:hypothetical protein
MIKEGQSLPPEVAKVNRYLHFVYKLVAILEVLMLASMYSVNLRGLDTVTYCLWAAWSVLGAVTLFFGGYSIVVSTSMLLQLCNKVLDSAKKSQKKPSAMEEDQLKKMRNLKWNHTVLKLLGYYVAGAGGLLHLAFLVPASLLFLPYICLLLGLISNSSLLHLVRMIKINLN